MNKELILHQSLRFQYIQNMEKVKKSLEVVREGPLLIGRKNLIEL